MKKYTVFYKMKNGTLQEVSGLSINEAMQFIDKMRGVKTLRYLSDAVEYEAQYSECAEDSGIEI